MYNMRKFRHFFSFYAVALLICAITPPLVATSCDDDESNNTDKTVHVTDIKVTPTTADMTIGTTQTLVVAVAPENATDKSYAWSTSNPSVATVADDVVTAVGVGNATLTVTTTDGKHTATCTVVVSEPEIPVTGITVTPSTLELEVGETNSLVVTVAPENASDKTYTWLSSDPSVVTVADDMVTAVGTGNATLTATTNDGNFTATCAVSVSEVSVTGITIAPASATIPTGMSQKLTVQITPDNAAEKRYTWTSSNPEVATVAFDEVTAYSEGTTTLTATTIDGGFTATCEITVGKIQATSSGGYYFGDIYNVKSGNYYFFMLSGNVTEEALVINGDGLAIVFDMNSPLATAPNIAPGTYTLKPDNMPDGASYDYIYYPGVDMGGSISGSFVYYLAEGGTPEQKEYYPVEDGTLVVTLEGENYTAVAQVIAAGRNYSFTFTGPVSIFDLTALYAPSMMPAKCQSFHK